LAGIRISRRFQWLGVAAALGAALSVTSPVPALAQGFFDFLFGGFRRAFPPPPRSYADPRYERRSVEPHDYSGSGIAYCVRLCDGRHFPITTHSADPAATCRAFCPATPTKIFSGSAIDHAWSADGRRYSDLPNAFVYRDRLVADCTCDGKSPAGLARIDPDNDPTLRPGDIVATGQGLMSYRGEGRRSAQFTPISRTPGLSPAMRRKLSATPVAPMPREIRRTAPASTTGQNVDQRGRASR